jgi:MEMO1 family protein
MNNQLPRLRPGIEIHPSPLAEKPGLLFRDPFRYTDEILIIPPLLAAGLVFFDGESTELDLQAYISKLAGQIIPSDVIKSLIDVLNNHGYLESVEFERLRADRHAEFASAPTRLAAHSGTGYPNQAEALRATLDQYLYDGVKPSTDPIIGLAAPHVSPWGGWQCYASAYGRLSGAAKEQVAGKTILLLGTSHYGQPEKFGMTRKPFVTPLGTINPDVETINWIAQRADGSIVMEDYCHSFEHSIEFQCIFLQQVLGSDFKIVPILCGPFLEALYTGEPPERDDKVMRFFDVLGELAELNAARYFWVLGIDLAHIGRRYGDEVSARADDGQMLEVKEQDHARLRKICEGNNEELFELVKPDQDPLKWCGFPPIYTFISAIPDARGELLRYDQWNIDEQSVVSFAAMEFKK